MQRALLLAGLFATTVLLSGCAEEDEITASVIQKSYTDADKRYYNNVGGVEEVNQNINIPVGTTKLTVKAIYNVGGVAEFTLRNPTGMTEKSDESVGGKQLRDESWFVTTNPKPGNWKFEVELAGGGQYAFGFYY